MNKNIQSDITITVPKISGSEKNGNVVSLKSVDISEENSTKSSPSNRERITPDKLPDELGLKQVIYEA